MKPIYFEKAPKSTLALLRYPPSNVESNDFTSEMDTEYGESAYIEYSQSTSQTRQHWTETMIPLP